MDLFVKNKTRYPSCVLKYIPPINSNGQRIVKLRFEEVEVESVRWNNALIGSVYGWNPVLKELRALPWGKGRCLV